MFRVIGLVVLVFIVVVGFRPIKSLFEGTVTTRRLLPKATTMAKTDPIRPIPPVRPSIQRLLLKLFVPLAFCLAYTAAGAQDLYFAGFSFAGDNIQNRQRYPAAEALQNEKDKDGVNVLDAALRKQLKELTRSDITLKYDLGDSGSGNATALAFALDQESVEDDKMGSQDLYIYRVIANVLVFDFQTKTVVADFPAMVQYQDLGVPGRTDEENRAVFRRIYLEPGFGANIFAEWVRRLSVTQINKSYSSHLAVRSVTIAPEAEALVPDALKKNDAYATQVAQTFEYSLASIQNIGLLPYTPGQAIAGKMVTRFANGDSYDLTLPKPDFTIDIRLRAFRTAKVETNATDQYVFGSFITLEVQQPDLQKIYVNADFKNLNYVVLDKSAAILPDPWQGYQTSLRELFNVLAEQISKRDAQALAEMTKAPDIDTQLAGFKEVIKKCM
ncbi:hypothetical protein [Burkholderia sp. L27(2015)]|uniref:hypothetical protein n=1 Tax=Burkholderia sp. L27(2015) TaxID=1641858 RepID=UPI00131C70EE|nr:hypothetical protein [Burkholderia sp. L27(2015)]